MLLLNKRVWTKLEPVEDGFEKELAAMAHREIRSETATTTGAEPGRGTGRRRCAGTRGSRRCSRFGRRRTRVATIDGLLAGVGGGIGDFTVD
jgi:hypothetical protein